MSAFFPLFEQAAQGLPLDERAAQAAVACLMTGDVPPEQVAGFLIGLKARGETISEIVGGVRALRAAMVPVTAQPGAIDVCGTGGKSQSTRNISTAVAIVVAACGVPVAKHGNRAASSKAGSADVLGELGIDLDAPLERVERGLHDAGIAFLWAQRHHPAMRHVAGVRRALGVRTLFNLLGPLSNPASVDRQLMGVYDPRWIGPMAEALARLGTRQAWVVHGSGGVDELSLSGPSEIAVLQDGSVRRLSLTPADFGLPAAPIEALAGGLPGENAAALLRLLNGEQGAYHDAVCLNASAALIVAGAAADPRAGVARAREALASGAAMTKLDAWRAALV